MQETQNSKRQNSFFWENPLCQKIYENEFGSLAVELITELLQFYKMDYTLSVFPHESNLKEEVTREKVSKKLGVNPDNDKNIPLLIQVLKTFFNNGNIQEKNLEIKKMEETKQEIKENNVKPLKNEQKDSREIKKEVISKEPDVVLKNKEVKEQPIPQKKEPEFIKENPKEIAIKEIKKQEAGQNNKAQIQPLPMNLRQNPKNFDAIQQQEMEIPKETKSNTQILLIHNKKLFSSTTT